MGFELVIDENGQARAPVIVDSSLPSKTYLLLERARTSTFVSARLAGKPTTAVAIYSLSPDSGSAPATPADLLPEVRSLLARNELAVARCLYRAAQGVDPSIADPEIEEAIDEREAQAAAARTSADSEAPLHVGGEVEAPIKVKVRAPPYTERARLARDQGVVIIQTIINRFGEVDEPRILKPLVFDLDLQALEAVCAWRFEPAKLAGRPVDVYYNLTINFRLESRKTR